MRQQTPTTNTTSPPYDTHRGFSLIEMAVVLAVLSLVAGTMLSVATAKIEQQQAASIDEKFDRLEDSLLRYYQQNDYLPCPASSSDAENTANFGRVTNCNAGAPAGTTDTGAGSNAIRIGVVPTRSLGLPDTAMLDPWGNRITYSVIKDLAIDRAKFASYSTTLTSGVIQITDLNGNQIPDDKPETVIAYTLVSHGKDGKGAANRLGTVVNVCDNAAKDGENCNNDVTFRDIDVQNSTVAANYYDDYVHWRERGRLLSVSVSSSSTTCTFALDAGWRTACVSKSDGTLWCWGGNDYGQLGNGTIGVDQTTPTKATNVTSCVQGTLSDAIGCITKSDGTAWCWGEGLMGDGSTTTPHLSPVQVSGLTGVLKVEAGEAFSCALKTDGTVWCWGDNWFAPGQAGVGDGTTQQRPTPVQVFTNATDLAVGDGFACAIKNDATLWCWGHNDYGQLGDGSTTSRASPVQVVGLTNVSKVALDQRNTCAIKTDTSLWCWGNNWYGTVGDGTAATDGSAHRYTPMQVKNSDGTNVTGVTQAVLGCHDVCALKTDGTVWCWGANWEGVAGDGGANGRRINPVQVSGLTNVTEIGADDSFACAKKSDGTIWCWGRGDAGQLGNGTTMDSNVPVQVLNFP